MFEIQNIFHWLHSDICFLFPLRIERNTVCLHFLTDG